jgi:hypothetical protein
MNEKSGAQDRGASAIPRASAEHWEALKSEYRRRVALAEARKSGSRTEAQAR